METNINNLANGPHKSFNHWFWLAVLAILLVGGGVIYALNMDEPDSPQVQTDWKTYTNAKYGFEFKYPSNLYEEKLPHALFSARSTEARLELGGVTPDGVEGEDWVSTGFDLEVDVVPKSILKIDITKSVPGEYISTKLNLDGLIAYRFDDIGGISHGPQVYIEHPDKKNYIVISYDASCSNGVCNGVNVEQLFNQILATFKFTDSLSFDGSKAKVGDKIGSMTIVAIENDREIVKFKGAVEVSGTYAAPTYDGILADIPSFTVDSESANQLPKLIGDDRTLWFCFSDNAEALSKLGTKTKKARITVDNYIIDTRGTETCNKADLVSVK